LVRRETFAIESAPAGPLSSRQLRAGYLIALGEFVDGYDLLVMGVALIFLKSNLGLSDTALGLLGAVTFLGAAVGLLVFGDLSDRYGRRAIFVLNLYFFVVCALASAFVTSLWQLATARFLIGVAIGMEIPASTAYLAEIAPERQRGALLGSLLNIMWILGALFSILLALPLIGWVGQESWRYLMGLGALPAFLILLARRSLPESPRWLLARGRIDEARAAMAHFGMSLTSTAESIGPTPLQASYRDLFVGPMRRRLALVTAIFFLNCLAGSVTTICTPLVMKEVGALSDTAALAFSGITWFVALIGTLVSMVLVDRVGRRRLCYGSTLAFSATALVLAVFGTHHPAILIGGLCVITLAAWSGIAVLTWIWASELFPTTLRGRSQGIASAACRVAAAANIFVMPVALRTVGFGLYVGVLAVPMLLIALLTALNPLLDSGGRALEEVSAGDGGEHHS
jgi:MFS transporter, putative metabolite transport protein